MDAHKENGQGNKETKVGTYKLTREELPNGDTKETREEKTITIRRGSPVERAAAPESRD